MDDRPLTDDIVAEDDTPSVRLDREADALLEQGRAAPQRLRRAVRQDTDEVAARGRARAGRLADGVRAEPVRSTALALGVGVLIGLLLRR